MITPTLPISLAEEIWEDGGSIKTLVDGELVERAQRSDAAAFAELVGRTSSASIRQAMLMLRNREEAEDQVQNSYIKAWLHIDQFQGQSKFSTWLLRIVINQCLMRLRQLRPNAIRYFEGTNDFNGPQPMAIADVRPTPEVDFAIEERAALIKREIRRLPLLLRSVLELRDLKELSTAETAVRLKISTTAVKSRLLRGRSELRSRLDTLGPGEVLCSFRTR